MCVGSVCVCFFQAEDGIRDLVRSRGLGDVYKRQVLLNESAADHRRRRDFAAAEADANAALRLVALALSLIHI